MQMHWYSCYTTRYLFDVLRNLTSPPIALQNIVCCANLVSSFACLKMLEDETFKHGIFAWLSVVSSLVSIGSRFVVVFTSIHSCSPVVCIGRSQQWWGERGLFHDDPGAQPICPQSIRCRRKFIPAESLHPYSERGNQSCHTCCCPSDTITGSWRENHHLMCELRSSEGQDHYVSRSRSAIPIIGLSIDILSSCVSHTLHLSLFLLKTPDLSAAVDYDFASVLRYTLERDTSFKSTCQMCKHLAVQRARRLLSSEFLPPVMSVHASVKTEDHLRFWLDGKHRRFLQPYVKIDMHNDSGMLAPGSEESVTYDLRVSSLLR